MTSPRQNQSFGDPARKAEETLRLIASLPAPDGLAGRVQARLRSAPGTRSGLNWNFRPANGWMFSPALRGLAAAAIVCVVAGGGWQIYSHVQPAPTARNQNVVLPARVGGNGAFSTGGAIARPDTLNGPVLAPAPQAENAVTHPAVKAAPPTSPAPKQAKQKKTAQKSGQQPAR